MTLPQRHHDAAIAEQVGEYAYLLRFGLYAHAAALELARGASGPSAHLAVSEGGEAPSGRVWCKDGSERPFYLGYVLDLAVSDRDLREELQRAWCVSSLVLLGDRLAAAGYFDRAPVLEMVRHLRNGVAHGNRFTIRNPGELVTWPAHMRTAACRSGNTFDITPELDGSRVLFEFMAPGDVLDLLISVGTHLKMLADPTFARQLRVR